MGKGAVRLIMYAMALALVWSLGAVSSVSAAVPGLPPSGKTLLGVGGATTPGKMTNVTKRRHNLHLIFLGWGQGVDYGKRINEWLADSAAGDYRLMVHLTIKNARGKVKITPRGLATGKGDAYLIAMSEAINNSNQIVYIRPMAEMNGHWNVYCAFNADGSRRGKAYSTKWYKHAFRRIALIMRGGDRSDINTRLTALGLPGLPATITALPSSGRVATVWNPQGEGKPNVAGNHPENYYPGGAYVDYVANDLYSQNGGVFWKGADALYKRYKTKPHMIAEWAPWGNDDPGFIDAMFKWVRKHPRVRAVIYFNGNSTNIFKIQAKKRSLKRYKANARGRRFTCLACGAST